MNKYLKFLFIILLILMFLLAIYYIFVYNSNKIVYDNNPLVQKQMIFENEIKDNLKKNKYSIDDANVYINPYNISPLSALITFASNEKGKIMVTVKGKNNDDLIKEYDLNKYNYIPIYGLYENYNNTVEIVFPSGIKKSFIIKTEEITNKPQASILVSNANLISDSFYFLSSNQLNKTYAYDRNGELRWFIDNTYNKIIGLDNGNFLICNSEYVYEINIIGKIINYYKIDDSFIDFDVINENILYLSKKTYDEIKEFNIVEARIDGISNKINLLEILISIDSDFITNMQNDFFDGCIIKYYDKTNDILLINPEKSYIIDFDYNRETIKWIISKRNVFSDVFSSFVLNIDEDEQFEILNAYLDNNTIAVIGKDYLSIPNYDIIGIYSDSYDINIYEKKYEINNNKKLIFKSSTILNNEYINYRFADYSNNALLLGEVYGFSIPFFNQFQLDNDYYTIVSEKEDNIEIFKMTFKNTTNSMIKINFNNLNCELSF